MSTEPNAPLPPSEGGSTGFVVTTVLSEASDDDKSETGFETDNSADASIATSASGGTGGDTMEIGPTLLTAAVNCMVVKSNGNVCGARIEDCRTRNHQELQKNPKRVGKSGVYNGVISNGKKATHPDGLKNTWISVEDHKARQATQKAALEAAGRDSMRQAEERLNSPRGDTVVTFNESETLLATPVNSPRKQAPSGRALTPEPPQRFVTSVPPIPQDTSHDWRQNDGTGDMAMAQMMQMTKMMETMAANMAATQAATTQSIQQMAATVIEAVVSLTDRPPGRPSDPPPITKWYAVARGRAPGVYASEEELDRQILGFQDPYYKIFHIRQDAVDWLRLELASYATTPSMVPRPSSYDDRNDPRNMRNNMPSVEQERHDRESVYHDSVTGPAKLNGEDTSKGTSGEIYGASIYTGAALKLLSPPNSSNETIDDLMEAIPDITSPGKLVDAASESSEQVANSLQALAELSTQRNNVMMRDTQYKNKARSALSKIKSPDDLMAIIDEVDEHQDKVRESAIHAIAEILRRAGWNEKHIERYTDAGGIVRLIERTQFLFMKLLLHFQKLQTHPDSWENKTLLHIEYHTLRLLFVRKYCANRAQMVLEMYCYLRDEADRGFMNLKLLSKITQQQARLYAELKPLTRNTGAKPRCSHCHTTSVHEGGANKCDLKDWKAKNARIMAKEIVKRAVTGDEVLQVVIQEVMEREVDNKG
jgi:hypothetical protein